MSDNSPHWREFFELYKITDLHSQANDSLQTLLNNHRSSNIRIASHQEIRRMIDHLGNDFVSDYESRGFTIEIRPMLGMQLYEICACDKDQWWFTVPKPVSNYHDFTFSHYIWNGSR
jgi:hypothetical protein